MLCALKSAQNAESSLDSAKDAYKEAQKIMQERMLKNLAFFARNKITKSLQTALNGGNKRFNLYFTQSEINIIDLNAKKFLYPKGAFLNIAQNLAQNPLNNDKWRIYSNNLRLGKIENKTSSATIEAMNKIAEIGLNSSLGASCGDFGNLGRLADSSPVSHPKFPKNSTTSTANTRICDLDSAIRTQNAESALFCHSERSEESKNNPSLRADSQNLRGNPPCKFNNYRLPHSHSLARNDAVLDSSLRLRSAQNDKNSVQNAESSDKIKSKKPLKSFCYFWLLPKVESPLTLNPNLPNNVDSATFCHSNSLSCHSERSEESKNNPSLRANPQDLRGNPPCEKTQNLQGGLPRATSRARNDDFNDFAKSALDSANSKQEANSSIVDEFSRSCEVSDADRTNGSSRKRGEREREKSPQDEFAPTYHLPPLFLPQTNIFGLCGGLFLDILVEQGYFFHSLLIYEEDAELFALSCYFVDYERLFSRTSPKSCYIFIENLLDKGFLNHYFYSKKITNNFLRLELSLLQSPKTRDFKALTFETYKANARGWGNFEDEMVGIRNTFANAQNAPFLRIDSKLQTPICVVGSGPSLESNIDFIRANQSKMLIFSCGTALKVLKKHKIAIDFQIEIERVPYLAEVLQNSNLGDTAILCASLVNPKVLEVAQNTILFMRGGSAASYIFDDTGKKIAPLEFCAPFVGNAGFSLACALSDEVIMCGMDCGFIKGFAKHASGSIYGDESAEIPRDCFKVEGNCADFEVFSNAIFSLSKESFALSIAHYKPKIVHNLSLGAKIKGANFTQNLSLKNRAKKMPLNSLIMEKTALTSAKKTLKDSALTFIDELKNALNCDNSKPIATKQELFCYIDLLTDFLAKISEKNPKIGILFEGSISHLLQSTMIALLSVKKNAISAEFSACKAVILGACEAFEREIGKLQ